MSETRSFKSPRSTPLKSSRMTIPQTISPVKSQLYNSLNSDKKEMITKLLYLFTFYSSKTSKYSYRQLNEKYFVQLIADLYETKNHIELEKNSVEEKEFMNVYFSSKGKKIGAGIRFEDFLQTLPIISVYMCPQIEQRQEATKQVVQYLLVLFDTKVSGLIGNQLLDNEQPINDETKQMVIKLMPAFNTVYKIYFSHEVAGKFNSADPQHESFEALMVMMKDFEVFPKLISAAQLFLLYQTTLKSPINNLMHETQYIKQKIHQKGQLFTLSKMLELMVSCSRLCLPKLMNLQNPEYDTAYQKETFKTLLQYMESIKSTKTSLKTLDRFREHRFSFILLEEYQNIDETGKFMKTFVLKDKVVKQSQKNMEFFGLFDKIQL